MGAVTRTPQRLGPVEVDAAARPFGGEVECGDQFCAVAKGGGVLVAVADGLGHGPEAADAARRACATLESAPDGQPLAALVERCHTALRRTRGAALCAAFFPRAQACVDWIAVGNVEGMLLRGSAARREAVIQRPGIVGHTLPRLQSSRLPLAPGDALVLATDGVERGIAGRIDTALDADMLLRRFATGTDDALILVARYAGEDA